MKIRSFLIAALMSCWFVACGKNEEATTAENTTSSNHQNSTLSKNSSEGDDLPLPPSGAVSYAKDELSGSLAVITELQIPSGNLEQYFADAPFFDSRLKEKHFILDNTPIEFIDTDAIWNKHRFDFSKEVFVFWLLDEYSEGGSPMFLGVIWDKDDIPSKVVGILTSS